MGSATKPTRGIGWVFLFALSRESTPFLRRRKILIRFPDAPCPACAFEVRRDDAIVLETGVGFDRAQRAIDWALTRFEPRLVVAAGFAGGLDPALEIGEIVVASQVVEPDEQVWRVALPVELGDRECGRIVTAPALVATDRAKRKLASDSGAIAVDMESAAIAEACQGANVPCSVVRAISDELGTSLSPHLASLLEGGRVSPARVVAAAIRRPSLVPEFWRLARDTKLAAKNLAEALNCLIAGTR